MVEINTTILWQVINFLVLMWVLKRYLYGPVTEMLDKRKERINNDLDEASRKNQEAEELKKEYKQELKEARHRAQEIVEEAEARGKKRRKEIIAEAQKEAERIKESKMEEVEQAKKEALNELRNQVASLSIMAAGKLIQENMDHEKHEKLINQYLQNLDKKKLGEVK